MDKDSRLEGTRPDKTCKDTKTASDQEKRQKDSSDYVLGAMNGSEAVTQQLDHEQKGNSILPSLWAWLTGKR